MKLKLEIKMDNAAFGETPEERGIELDCIIGGLAKRMREQGVNAGDSWRLMDTNGNRVGEATCK